MKPLKYRSKKVEYKGVKFDSETEKDYFMYLESEGYIYNKTFYTQVKYIIQSGFKLNGKTIRPIAYIADFVIRDKDGTEKVVDIKGFMVTAVFKIKIKMMAKVFGIEVLTLGKCPKYFLEENNGFEWMLMSVKTKIRECPKKYRDKNDDKPWILNKDLLKLRADNKKNC